MHGAQRIIRIDQFLQAQVWMVSGGTLSLMPILIVQLHALLVCTNALSIEWRRRPLPGTRIPRQELRSVHGK